MKCKEKALLIGIVLYFFLALGCVIPNESQTIQSEECPFGSFIEISNHYNKILEQEEASSTEYIFCDLTNIGDALRRFVQTKRPKGFPTSKSGNVFIKRKHLLFTLHHFSKLSKTFPPKPTEAKRHLISLRKLII